MGETGSVMVCPPVGDVILDGEGVDLVQGLKVMEVG